MDVAEIINEARDLHPSFTPQKSPPQVVRRFLSRYQQELLTRLAQIERDALQEVDTVTLPLGDFDAGEEIEAHILVHGGTVRFTEATRNPEPLELVEFKERLDRYRYRWGAYIQGTTLFLLGEAEDWTDVATIDLYYFPVAAELETLDAEFVLPGHPRKVLVAAAGAFMAQRATLETARGFLEAQAYCEERWLDEVTGRRRATVGVVREVW